MCEKLFKKDDSRASHALVRASNGEDIKIFARIFILATHAIGNSHILLNSQNEKSPTGLANSSGTVGKYLMDHLKFFYRGRIQSKGSTSQNGI